MYAHTHTELVLFVGSLMNMQINLHSMINTCLFALNGIYSFTTFHSCAKMQKYHTD